MTELRSEETQTSDTISRRTLLKGLGGVGALLASGLTGCERKPKRQIVSYSQMPEYQRPGEVLHYASTWTEGPCPYGMLVKTVDGRPIKIEGNPEMPVNGGASSAAMQASVMGLYNPERLRQPLIGGQAATWQEADRRIVDALSQSWSVVLLTRANLGPSERRLLDRIRSLTASAPQGRMRFRHFAYDPAQDPVLAAGLGEHLPRYDRAKVILSVGCDFLGVDGAPLEAIRQFMERRSPTPDHPEMSRLYVAESSFSQTGATADHRIRLRPSQSGPLLEALTRAIRGERDISSFADRYHLNPAVLAALVEDLRGTRGQALVVAGPYLPPETQAAAMELNRELGAISETLAEASYPAVLRADGPAEIGASLKGRVDALILLGVNPVYDWPLGDFQALMGEAGLTVGHGLALDETLSVCDVALPSAHNLESWNDAAPRPRILSICQPVLAPFFNGRQEFDSLLTWARSLAPQDPAFSAKDWYEYVRELWRTEIYPAAGSPVAFESFWEGVLRTGVYRYRLQSPATRPKASRSAGEPQGLELIVRPHHAVYDGRFACDGLLQELPDPVSKLVWDNALSLSPATAKKQGLVTGDVVDVVLGDGKVFQQAVWVQPGMADGALVATLGYGRTRAGRHGSARGFRITCLDGEGATSGLAYGVTLRKTGKTHELAVTQKHPDQAGRPIVLEGTLEEYRRDPGFVAHRRHMPPPAEIHRAFDYSGRNKWGMAIDLTKCVGCGTCTVACQAENNIPVVGKDEVAKGREMHWIRVDRYFEGEEDDLRMVSQPMPCQHCENAPCENVCPVLATTHSPTGLNEMTYNRCVGTRYCSNNCPYKVRRFNYLAYTKDDIGQSTQTLAYNPQVTVRSRGVMEKCTFCVQRIVHAMDQAKRHGRAHPSGSAEAFGVPPHTVQTACQQACPAGAIVFGDLNDPSHFAAQLSRSERGYRLLVELNVEPRVTYLALLHNPHPSLARKPRASDAHMDEESGE